MRGLRGEVLPPAMEMNLRAQSPLCSRGRPALVVRPVAAATGLTLVSYDLSCCFLPLFAFWFFLGPVWLAKILAVVFSLLFGN